MKRETNRTWVERTPQTNLAGDGLAAYNPVLRRLLANRGIVSAQDASIFMERKGPLHDPFLLTGMEAAVDRLGSAVRGGERIAVYGDYDVDGVTATVLMVQVLR